MTTLVTLHFDGGCCTTNANHEWAAMGIVVLKVLLLIELSIIYIHVVRSGSPATLLYSNLTRGLLGEPYLLQPRALASASAGASRRPMIQSTHAVATPFAQSPLFFFTSCQWRRTVVLYMLVDREYHDTNRSGRKPRSNVNPGQKCACVMGCGGGLFFFNDR